MLPSTEGERECHVATVFTRIIEVEVLACFLWREPSCLAFHDLPSASVRRDRSTVDPAPRR